jgi:hypothetical protein
VRGACDLDQSDRNYETFSLRSRELFHPSCAAENKRDRERDEGWFVMSSKISSASGSTRLTPLPKPPETGAAKKMNGGLQVPDGVDVSKGAVIKGPGNGGLNLPDTFEPAK